MKLTHELIRLGLQLSEESIAAHDLWSWLPSHKIAEKHHGDHASQFCPDNRNVMVEAAMYLAHLTRPDEPVMAEEQEWFTRCPCGEDHEGETP